RAVAEGAARPQGGTQVGAGQGRGCLDALHRRPQGPGGADACSFGLGADGPYPSAESAGPAQFGDDRVPFPVHVPCAVDVAGPVGGVEGLVQLREPLAVAGESGRVEDGVPVGGPQPPAAGRQVESGDVLSGGGEQAAEVAHAAGVPQPRRLAACFQEPPAVDAGQPPCVAGGGQGGQEPAHAEALCDGPGTVLIVTGPDGIPLALACQERFGPGG